MPRIIPVELFDKAVAHYGKSQSCVKSARRYGLGTTTLHRELVKRGVECKGLDIFRKRITKLPSADVLKELYESGLKPTEIGARYGAGNFAVIAALRKAGIERKPQGNSYISLSSAENEKLMSLHAAGHNYAEIAALMDLSPITISRLFRKRGIFAKDNRRSRHGSWKGGRIITPAGYVRVLIDFDDAIASMRDHAGYVLEHRVAMARSLHRPLERRETVHHINGDVGDNRLENLQLRSGPHGKGSKMQCLDCGSHNVAAVKL